MILLHSGIAECELFHSTFQPYVRPLYVKKLNVTKSVSNFEGSLGKIERLANINKAMRRIQTARGPRSARTGTSKTINGYLFNSVIGKGQYGTVYKVMSVGKREVFAAKAISKAQIQDGGSHMRLQREVDVLAFLEHPNIVHLHDFFSDNENYYLIMDLCTGGELKGYIEKNGKIKEETAALLFYQIVSAIAYCHASGIAHRDIKPQNIMIGKFPIVKVTDFGLCGMIENEPMTEFCGSLGYCSPECLFKAPYDGKLSDIWSLGVTLYAMVTGSLPWDCSDQTKMFSQILEAKYPEPKVSPACKNLIGSLLKVQPTDRMPLNEVLKHGWFKIAGQAQVVSRGDEKINLKKIMIYKPGKTKQLQISRDENEQEIVSPYGDQMTSGQLLRKNRSNNLLLRS